MPRVSESDRTKTLYLTSSPVNPLPMWLGSKSSLGQSLLPVIYDLVAPVPPVTQSVEWPQEAGAGITWTCRWGDRDLGHSVRGTGPQPGGCGET